MRNRPTRVAIASCRADTEAAADDLYPDADQPVLDVALHRTGLLPASVSWDDDDIDWREFDAAVVRSTWDSVNRPAAFLAWARRTSEVTTLLNPLAAIEWNLDKAYLRTLAERGVAVVPTRWIAHESEWEAPGQEFVVKPAMSAGGRETARYRPEEAAAADAHVRRILSSGKTAMVQPYMTSVDAESRGETKLVFIDGAFSHAVRVGPQLFAGEGVRPRPWERPVPTELVAAAPAQVTAAEAVLAAVDAEVGAPLLYARVDLVAGPTDEPLLAEVELVDPILFLRHEPAAAARLAAAIARLLTVPANR